MALRFLIGALLSLITASKSFPYDPSSFEERWFSVPIDHYNFRPVTPNNTFALRYFINTDCYNGTSVLFYAGNEAPIEMFLDNCGFLLEAACTQLGAAVVFAEHRYYGKSMPLGDDSLRSPEALSYLTVEQAMQDFNLLNLHLGKTLQSSSRRSARENTKYAQTLPIIVAGGSYGGNLALWLRLKNPNLWAGAIASSATPLKHLLRTTNAFTQIETQVYANVSKQVPDWIRQGWQDLYQGDSARVREALGLCSTAASVLAVENLHGWIGDALETMVQYGYPYATHVYNPVPGYPFEVAAKRMKPGFLKAFRAAVDVFYNFTGQVGPCYGDRHIVLHARSHWHRTGQLDRVYRQSTAAGSEEMKRILVMEEEEDSNNDDANLEHAWGYQTCTEVYQPMPTNGVTDFELPYTPNQTEYFLHCQEKYGVTPRPDWEEMTFMGDNIESGTNIFLTHGQLDPWRAAGILPKPTFGPSIIIRTIEHGAHHFDLRPSHDLDPVSVTSVRNEQLASMEQWIREWDP